MVCRLYVKGLMELNTAGGTGFTLFLLIVSFILTTVLLVVPIAYDRYVVIKFAEFSWDKCRRPAQFLAQARTRLILHSFGTFLLFLAAMIVTISGMWWVSSLNLAWTNPGCKNPDDDAQAGLGDEYKSGLNQWCMTKKASAIFDWYVSIWHH